MALIRTFDVFVRTIRESITSESEVLDVKDALAMFSDIEQRKRKEGADKHAIHRTWRQETARDLAQFSNADGGCLLFGVAESCNVISKIRPMGDGAMASLHEHIKEARKFLAPKDTEIHLDPIRVEGGNVLAVNVPKSRRLVWVDASRAGGADYHCYEVVQRRGLAKVYLSAAEIEARLEQLRGELDDANTPSSRLSQLAERQPRDVKFNSGLYLHRHSGVQQLSATDYHAWITTTPDVSIGYFSLRLNIGRDYADTIPVPFSRVVDAFRHEGRGRPDDIHIRFDAALYVDVRRNPAGVRWK